MEATEDIFLAFDVYGTLLSTDSIAKQLAAHFGEQKAASLAAAWRKYQLEYSWRLNSMQKYESFSNVTSKSLRHALAEANVSLDAKEVEDLIKAYNTLGVFPDVPPVFKHLEENSNIHASVFSNGDPSMIQASLSQSPDLSPHASIFRKVVVVEPTKRFKPDPQVYQYLCKQLGKDEKGQEKDVWLVSGNPFDVVGANAVGLRTCWVDRSGRGWVDQLGDGEKGKPTLIVSGLHEVVSKVKEHVANA